MDEATTGIPPISKLKREKGLTQPTLEIEAVATHFKRRMLHPASPPHLTDAAAVGHEDVARRGKQVHAGMIYGAAYEQQHRWTADMGSGQQIAADRAPHVSSLGRIRSPVTARPPAPVRKLP